LIDKGNNNRFINFVYQKRLLKSVANKPIFHNEDDESKLFPAKDLYYDVSSFRQVLPEYIEHLNCLCTQTKNIIDRELFLITEKSSSFFKVFSPSAFLDTVVFAEDNKALVGFTEVLNFLLDLILEPLGIEFLFIFVV